MSRVPTLHERAAGVLLHVTSLPGTGPTGELGAEAYAFVDFLAAAGQRWWQVLPLHPPAAGDSPYTADSIMAGNPLLIDLTALVRDGWLTEAEAAPPAQRRADACDFPAARRFKTARLRRAHQRFRSEAGRRERHALARFCQAHAAWLGDYALFKALKERFRGKPWTEWPPAVRTRRERTLEALRETLAVPIERHCFVQWQFHQQWQALKRYAERQGVGLIGDVPIYPALDSADVWANQAVFHLDAQGRPKVVAGVPPDDYSATGQLWGNPVYRWDAMRRRGYRLWMQRLQAALEQLHVLRLDHFIGFVRYWEVSAKARDARGGRFRQGPGEAFFRAVEGTLGRLPFIAEDLGLVTPAVTALRERLAMPGMRVLQFGLGNSTGDSDNLPHRFPEASVVYTGTHDNETAQGWWRRVTGTRRRRGQGDQAAIVQAYLGADGQPVHWAMIRAVYQSVAHVAMVPAQDLLGLGNGARMNRPGVARGNWRWRLSPGALDRALAEDLFRLTAATGRAPRRTNRRKDA